MSLIHLLSFPPASPPSPLLLSRHHSRGNDVSKFPPLETCHHYLNREKSSVSVERVSCAVVAVEILREKYLKRGVKVKFSPREEYGDEMSHFMKRCSAGRRRVDRKAWVF